jgi:hypothetical protein
MSRRLRFADLPRLAQVATGLVLVQSWVLTAEFVIDRHGLSEHLPFYRHGNICVWDLAVLTAVTTGLVLLSRREREVL